MTKDNVLVIHDAASLETWRRELRSIVRPRILSAVEFRLDGLSAEHNASLSALAGDYRRACGCASSGLFMSAAVLGIGGSYFLAGHHVSDIRLMDLVFLVGATALAALCGKTVGLLLARWRLLRLAKNAHGALTKSHEPSHSTTNGGN